MEFYKIIFNEDGKNPNEHNRADLMDDKTYYKYIHHSQIKSAVPYSDELDWVVVELIDGTIIHTEIFEAVDLRSAKDVHTFRGVSEGKAKK